MINVTKLNGDGIILNAELIETVESRPDTLITLTTGNKIMVKEKVEDIIKRVEDYKRQVNMLTREKLSALLREEEE